MKTIEPFGYFKAEPFGWTDCAETDEGARPLWDNEAMSAVENQRDDLLAALDHFVTWARGQHRAQSKGCHATFDMMMLRDEIDFAESAVESVKGGAA